MLLYGSNPYVVGNKTIVWNLGSLNESVPILNLVPPNNLGAMNNYDFDQRYASYIMDNTENFILFMSSIVLPLYQGLDVYLLVSEIAYNSWAIDLAESLVKFIQQRYGINATLVNTYDDYMDAISAETDNEYSMITHLPYLDMDKDRYAYIMSSRNQGDSYGE